MLSLRYFRSAQNISTSVLLGVVFVLLVGFAVVLRSAPVAIDSAFSVTGSFNVTGSQVVFVDDQVGYTFYRDDANFGQCVYSKTQDAGATWSAPISVDAQADCVKVVVWYDQWTPGDSGSYIHIVTMDTSSDDLWYNRLDTSTDTLLLGSAPVNIASNSGQSPGLSENANTHSVAKATDGVLYATVADNSDSYVVSCSTSCNLATSWTEVTNPFTNNATDHNLLAPLTGGDVMLINRDISLDDIRARVWNGASWGGWTTIDANAPESGVYDGGMAIALNHDTNTLYLAYVADNEDFTTADHDIRTFRYSAGTWTAGSDVLTNDAGRGLQNVAIGVDQNTDSIYVAYLARSTIGSAGTAELFWQRSTDNLATWDGESGPLTSGAGTYYGPVMTIHDDERLYATWLNGSSYDWLGETVADIGPDTILSATGTVPTTVRAGETSYIGGTFVLTSRNARTLSAITLTESGSIDAQGEIETVALRYDLDTTAPYDCVSESYSPADSQFGATDTSGFSAADGISDFSGTLVTVSSTQSVCLYPEIGIAAAATDGDTIELSINDAATDVTVSGTVVTPSTPVFLSGTTTVVSPVLTQTHYHWRNDDGSESGATSATGGIEDTPLSALIKNSARRLRLQVSAEGSTSSLSHQFRLEYATAAPSCTAASGWAVVSTTSFAWQLADSPFVVDGTDTTNVLSSGNGAVTDENSSFLTPNGAFRDTTILSNSLTFGTTSFAEFEYGVLATTNAEDGETYCFRLTKNGTPLEQYDRYAEATVAADVLVSATGTAVSSVDIPTSQQYFGGAFVLRETAASRLVQSITVSETGSVDAGLGLANVALYYDLDTTAPYDCASESYGNGATQFGVVDADGMSAPNGTSTFTDSVLISTTSTLCLYPVADVTGLAQNNQTVAFTITNPATDVLVSGGGSVGPSTPQAISGSTNLNGAVLTQTNYHWRNDDGSETGATSATGGSEDVSVNDISVATPIRLRVGISNEGATSSVPTSFTLQFAPRITTCAAAPSWTDVSALADDDWDYFDSSFLTHGSTTTNVPIADGGVSNPNTTFIGASGGVVELPGVSGTSSLTQSQYTDLEFSITTTDFTPNDTDYCFRVLGNGQPLPSYSVYPEINTAPKRDYRIQRGTTIISTTSAFITAGVDYTAPANSNSAFIRITNSHHTGAGDTAGGGSQDADEVTAAIANPGNLATSIEFVRTTDASDETYVDWEIIEFIGATGTDNQMVVRDVGALTIGGTSEVATGTVVSGVADDSDVVVFITGIRNEITNRNYYTGQITSDWSASSSAPVFTRVVSDNAVLEVSYAVVEFVGVNWRVQRVEHIYNAAGVTETSSIAPVSSLARTFLHVQKRVGAINTVPTFGHEVWLSSIGAVSFRLDSDADMLVDHVAVAWVIENTQTGSNAMEVQRLNGVTIGGSEPLSLAINVPSAVSATDNTSVTLVSRAAGLNTAHPRAIAGFTLTSTNAAQLWRSDTGTELTYRAEIIEWPVADLAQVQNYYRFYVDNNTLTPSDPWPPGVADLGENTAITITDEPLGEGDHVRLRMTVSVRNANMPAGFASYQLEYGERISTCSAISTWSAIGSAASSSIWRGVAATSTVDGTALSVDPPTPGDLLISVSDVAGRLVEENPALANPFPVAAGEDIEYDWYVSHNGASPSTEYCFRMVLNDGTELDGYNNYPVIRTAGYSPRTTNWRWYDDVDQETPTTPLAAENVAPIDVSRGDTLALRVNVAEVKAVTGNNARFTVQFSTDSTFTADVATVVATSSCVADSLWCYVDGSAVSDGATINTAVLSNGDGCVAGAGNGCGTHHESAQPLSGHTHGAGFTQEYSFLLEQSGARTNAVYYFRLFDQVNNIPVTPLGTSTYPSVSTEASALTFSVAGLPAGTTTQAQTLTVSSTPVSIDFGTLPLQTDVFAAQRVTVDSNATDGYQVLIYSDQALTSAGGSVIPDLAASNSSPVNWASVCTATTTSCFGYRTSDATLQGGSTRFAPTGVYAGLSRDPAELFFSATPAIDTHDVVYRTLIRPLQPAGDYVTNIVYVAVPSH